MKQEQEWFEKLVAFYQRLLPFSLQFFKNPLQSITKIPSLSAWEIALTQFSFSVASGLLTGLVSFNLLYLFWSVFVFPIVSIIVSFVFSCLLHYAILFYFKKDLGISAMWNLIVFANLPFLALRIVSPLVMTVDIVGIIFTSFLLVVGLIENHQLDKRKVIHTVVYLAVLLGIAFVLEKLSLNLF